MLRSMHLSAISLLWVACAPSVPRPAEKQRVPDAAADLSPAADGAPDEHTQTRPPPGTATDARDATETDTQAKTDVQPDARLDARLDNRSDLQSDIGLEIRSDLRSDLRPDLRTEVDADVGAEAGAETGPEIGRDALSDDGPPPVLPRAGDVVIDELLINPAGTDTNREWIEIVNTTALTLDLRQLHVADAATEVAVDAGGLAAGGILVVGQSLDAAKNGGGPVDLSFGNTISLNNPGDSITLCLGPCADGLILNQVSWTADLGDAYDGHAAIVDPTSGAFCPADQPFGNAGSFGSPGAINPPCGI